MTEILILLGAPGAGKGTVAQYLRENYNVCHFSTGNLLRNEVQSKTEIGLKVSDILSSGGLVGDDIVNEIVRKNIGEVLGKGKIVILDGYPRTESQAVVLDSLMDGTLKSKIKVLLLDVEDGVVVRRVSLRRVCSKCGNTYGPQDKIEVCACGGDLIRRKDDNESVVRERLKGYKKEIQPILNHFSDRLVKVLGEGTPEEVLQRVDETLKLFGIEKRR